MDVTKCIDDTDLINLSDIVRHFINIKKTKYRNLPLSSFSFVFLFCILCILYSYVNRPKNNSIFQEDDAFDLVKFLESNDRTIAESQDILSVSSTLSNALDPLNDIKLEELLDISITELQQSYYDFDANGALQQRHTPNKMNTTQCMVDNTGNSKGNNVRGTQANRRARRHITGQRDADHFDNRKSTGNAFQGRRFMVPKASPICNEKTKANP